MPLARDAEADPLIDLDGPAIDGIDPETGMGRAAAALAQRKGDSGPQETLAQPLAGQIGPQIDLDRQQPLGFIDLKDPHIAVRVVESRKDPVRPTRGIQLGEVIGILGVVTIDLVEAVIDPGRALRGIVDGHRDEAEPQASPPGQNSSAGSASRLSPPRVIWAASPSASARILSA